MKEMPENTQSPKHGSCRLVVAVTGASGAYAARLLIERSPWPVALVASRYGEDLCRREVGSFATLADAADVVYGIDDLAAPIASGSVATAGMVALPCTTNTLGQIANGLADTLITRAAHCHLKERRRLVLCVRETPWSAIDFENARRVSEAGAIVMPLSPPFYMFDRRPPREVSMHALLECFVDRVLALLGHAAGKTWEDLC